MINVKLEKNNIFITDENLQLLNVLFKNINKKTVVDIKFVKNFLTKITQSYFSQEKNEINYEFHILFIFLNILLYKIKVDKNDFFKYIIIYLNINIKIRKKINNIFNNCLKTIETESFEIFGVYYKFTDKNITFLKENVLTKFFTECFLENDPINIDNIEDIYKVKINKFITQSLKQNIEYYLNNINSNNHTRCSNNRISFFNNIFKICQLNDFNKSKNNKINIEKNRNNTLIKYYNIIRGKLSKNPEIFDNFPLINQLFTSINIGKNNQIFTKEQSFQLNKKIENKIYLYLIEKIDDKIVDIISKNAAKELIDFLGYGIYVDINTFEVIKINYDVLEEEVLNFIDLLF